MGRTEKSQGLAPPAVRKDIRAKQARHIINKVVPGILASNGRARGGAEGSELFADPQPVLHSDVGREEQQGGDDATAYIKRKGQGRRKAKDSGGDEVIVRGGHERSNAGKGKGRRRNDSLDQELLADLSLKSTPRPKSPTKERRVRIVTTDTLTAAHMLAFDASKPTNKKAGNVCVLNMASPLRPGGGVLSGATSQEEFLCARTTLLTSLKETFYRLPELGGIWTSDVLVFRSALPLGDSKGDLGPGERYYIDVISAGMLRFPELEGEEDEEKRLGKKDREVAEAKMRAVLRIAARKGVKKLVLGAWGCGAYGNPVKDIAQIWKKVLDGAPANKAKKNKASVEVETWPEIEDIIFAINNRKMATDFAKAYSSDIEVEPGPDSSSIDDEEEDEEDKVAEELRTKIQEMESQLGKVWNPDLKARMGVILEGLKAQLREREGDDGEHGESSEEDDEEGEKVDELGGNDEVDSDVEDESDEVDNASDDEERR